MIDVLWEEAGLPEKSLPPMLRARGADRVGNAARLAEENVAAAGSGLSKGG
jgi:hypothetical protein